MRKENNCRFADYDYEESNYVYTLCEERRDWRIHIEEHITEAKEEIIENDNKNKDAIIANDNANKNAIIANDNTNTKSIIDTIKTWWTNKPSWWNN